MSIAGWYSSAISLLWKLPLPGESYPVHLTLLGSVIIPKLVQMRVSGPGPWLNWTTLKGHLSFTVSTVILYLPILFLPRSLHRNCSNVAPPNKLPECPSFRVCFPRDSTWNIHSKLATFIHTHTYAHAQFILVP